MKKGQLIVISGPSGAGKGTICKAYMEKHPDAFLSVSVTEREPRPEEIDGVHYHFLDKEGFDKLIAEEGLLEWARYGSNRYGSPKAPVLEAIDRGRDVILEIEVVGAKQVKKQYPDGTFVFIAPPSAEVLRERLTGRNTESSEQIETRLEKAMTELESMPEYDYIVINDQLPDAVRDVENILEAVRLRPCQQNEIIQKLLKK